jgi:hypothetical protein
MKLNINQMCKSIGQRLESYTIKRPQEVLLVTLETQGTSDLVLIYNGFSGSLMHPTNFDPEQPVIPAEAKIITIDRLASPYNPEKPNYIEAGLTWEQMESLLLEMNI